MTFLRVRVNDSLGGEGSTRESRESQGAITHMSTCKSKPDIPPASTDPARGRVPYEATSRSAPIRILRLAQVIDMTGLGKSKIYELQAQGRFPTSVRITEHSVGWVEQEVQAWLTGRLAERKIRPRRQSPINPAAQLTFGQLSVVCRDALRRATSWSTPVYARSASNPLPQFLFISMDARP
jgi:prophage regulatory protein